MDTQQGLWPRLAVPTVSVLIGILSYGSQYLFHKIDPGPLTDKESTCFNVLVVCIWISYTRAVLTDPGRVPSGWNLDSKRDDIDEHLVRLRFCRKCDAAKPPRAHHCKVCQRCVPKMDHHCPWTANCVSHFTFPHFMRFLLYAVTSMACLESFLYRRAAIIWSNRDLRYDLGPTVQQMIALFLLIIVNSLTLFLVGITFFRACYSLVCNVSTIESWEIERHEQLLRRAKVLGGYLDGPDGLRIRIRRQEFPYDIGIMRNIAVSMGSKNPFSWLFPLSRTPATSGTVFDTNGFEEPGSNWPPPDPDRMPRHQRSDEAIEAFETQHSGLSNLQEVAAFKRRQDEDYSRRMNMRDVQRRTPFHVRFGSSSSVQSENETVEEESMTESGEEGWQDSGGNRLRDYGVDEDIEFYDEDDIPLAELLQKRHTSRRSASASPILQH